MGFKIVDIDESAGTLEGAKIGLNNYFGRIKVQIDRVENSESSYIVKFGYVYVYEGSEKESLDARIGSVSIMANRFINLLVK